MKSTLFQTPILDSELRSNKNKSHFFQTIQNAKQNGRTRRHAAARSGAFRRAAARSQNEPNGSPQTHMHTRAFQRLAVVGPPNSLRI